jgi:hypothetical protein
MGLEADYDLRLPQRTVGRAIKERVHPFAA